MSNSPRPETTTRDTKLCSACRGRRKKCSPHNRDWENSQQKCNFCEEHGLPCGPNLRYSEDPKVIRRRTVVSDNEIAEGSNQEGERHLEGSTVWIASNPPAPTARRKRRRNEGPANDGRVEDEGEASGATSIENLKKTALLKLEELYAFQNSLAYASQPSFVYCHAHGSQQPYHDLSIEEKLHDLFIYTYDIAVKAKDQDESDVARWIFFALVFALDQYPQWFDKRKRHILLKIALAFQELGHRWEGEYVLLKIAGMYNMSALSSQDYLHRLADSFPNSSMCIRRALADRYDETVGGNLFDSNLNVPPLHAAVQHQNSSIILALLPNPNDYSSLPPAPSLTISSNVGHMRVNLEDRDINGRTALFAAIVNGDESCCFALLRCGANANTRDDHGHTPLEVAAGGGYLNILKNLIKFGAHLNPDITGCSSLPLHAAIESSNFRPEIINHLLISGAEVGLRRLTDNKHAIHLAIDQGYHELAQSMRGRMPSLNQTSFINQDPSMSQIIP